MFCTGSIRIQYTGILKNKSILCNKQIFSSMKQLLKITRIYVQKYA